MKKLSKIKIIALALTLIIVLPLYSLADGTFYNASVEASGVPSVSAESFVVCDAKTGEILFSKNENARMPVASTTKIMTCLVVLENAKLDDIVTVKSEDCGIEGSSIYLYEGEKISVRDLLYALMLESANDSAVCLANHVSGSLSEFSRLMNERAKTLGLKNTNFNNPHGLEDPEHYSTALDMSVIWREAMKNETFREIVSTKTYRIDLSDEDGYRFLSNHNKLLKNFEYCIGGKTGYTKSAGRCLVTAASKSGAELVMVTLNDPDDWLDHENMLTYLLEQYSTVDIATPGSVRVSVSVVGGTENEVTLSNRDALSLTLRDPTKLETKLEAPRFIYAPIKDKDEPLAYVKYLYDGEEIGSLPLYPEKEISLYKKDGFFKRFLNFIFN